MSSGGESDRKEVNTLTNWEIEDEIEDLSLELRRLYGAGVSATYRCKTCYRLASEHDEANVKGCRRKSIKSQDYIHDLEVQRDDLRGAVTLGREAHNNAIENRHLKTRVIVFKDMAKQTTDNNETLLEKVRQTLTLYSQYGAGGMEWTHVHGLLVDLGTNVGYPISDANVGSARTSSANKPIPSTSPHRPHRRRSRFRKETRTTPSPTSSVIVASTALLLNIRPLFPHL